MNPHGPSRIAPSCPQCGAAVHVPLGTTPGAGLGVVRCFHHFGRLFAVDDSWPRESIDV
ncbi:hypothetical protein [Nannocystis pusilla]|uniref:hypothetical protein n=1 Tax=Nannocystis pusilla TaxID=889268 RepID=UPI003B81FA48